MMKKKTDTAVETVKNNKKGFATFLVITGLIICFIGGYFFNDLTKDPSIRTVEWVMDTISKHGYYLDEETGEIKKLTGEDISDLIVSSFLDKYSDYYTAEEYADVVATNKGNNFGIGTTFLSAKSDLTVFRVVGNSPAFYAGIEKGDVLTGARKSGEDKVVFSARGDYSSFLSNVSVGEEFMLYATRNGEEKTFNLAKQVFTSSYVAYYDNQTKGWFTSDGAGAEGLTFITGASDAMSSLPDGVAYIKFDSFMGKAAFEMKTVMEYIKSQNKTGIILDLRDNGGGQMDILSSVSSYFIKSPDTQTPIIAYAEEVSGRIEHFNASGCNFNDNIRKITVIANNYTASASECLIGAMLHYGTAFSVDNLVIENGSGATGKTFGKGIMQSTFFNTITGEALKLTVAKIYFPDKTTSIHGVGISTTDANTVSPENALQRAVDIASN